MKASILGLGVVIALLGCGTPDGQYDSIKRAATASVDIYRDGKKPDRGYKEIGLLTDDAALGEQGEVEAKFVKQAKRMGGNAVILHPLIKTGGELKGFSIVETYLYKASVIVYE
jgi:hypothetical protein